MALILLALFIGLPLLEVAVFIQVGGAIGLWPTIAATVATALAGSLLLRAQGLATLMRARAQMDQGQLPARERRGCDWAGSPAGVSMPSTMGSTAAMLSTTPTSRGTGSTRSPAQP